MAQSGNVVIVQDFRGVNVKDQPFAIADSEAQVAHNVIVRDLGVEIRGGYELFAEDAARQGGVTMLEPFYPRNQQDQLVFANDGEYFYITASNQTWQSIGSMGPTPTLNPTALQYDNLLIFGTGEVGNPTKKWDGALFTDVTTPPDANADVRFFAKYQGQDIDYICAAGLGLDNPLNNSTTLYFTDDPDNWASAAAGFLLLGKSDGQEITGLANQNQLVAYKEKSKYYLSSFYEQNTGTFTLLVNGEDNSSGSPNHECLLEVDGDIFSFTQKGKSIEGFGLEGTASGLARPQQYATFINPIIDSANWRKEIITSLRSVKYDRFTLFSVPYLGSQTNNLTLWGDLDTPTRNGQPSWTTSNLRAGDLTLFEDENGQDDLYFGDALSPRIYKYTPRIYTDNGFEYTRIWRSKKWSLYSRPDWENMYTVIISGLIRTITELTLTVVIQGKVQKYIIDKEQIIEGSNPGGGGGFIGNLYIGGEYTGGNSVESDRYRFLACAAIPNALRYCNSVEVELRNSGKGQFWRMDYLSLNEEVNWENIPAKHKNLRAA